MLINTGWKNKQRIRGTTFYVRIRNGKFWVEEDWTDRGIVPELLAAGELAFWIPKRYKSLIRSACHPSKPTRQSR